MRLQAGEQAGQISKPPGYLRQLAAPAGLKIGSRVQDGPSDWLQVLIANQRKLEEAAPTLRPALKPTSIPWLSLPKQSSNLPTDLTRNQGRETQKDQDLTRITLIAVNETWSEFALRPYRAAEKRPSFR
jgi:hypothetical protein